MVDVEWTGSTFAEVPPLWRSIRLLVVRDLERSPDNLEETPTPLKVSVVSPARLFASATDLIQDADVVVLDYPFVNADVCGVLLDELPARARLCDTFVASAALVDQGDVESARRLARARFDDVIPANVSAAELRSRLAVLAARRRLASSDAPQEDPAHTAPEEPGELFGSSAAMKEFRRLLRRVAATDVSVLLTGESGTGKELAAKAIHERSPRASGPFVPINCAAIPAELLESELFGYEKGAFTGADRARRGRFEDAHGGTLFLDEVGALAPSLQVKLLRFLEDFMLERVGGRQPIPLDVRIIAATNRDLEGAVERAEFRGDLFFRLNVFQLTLPALRDREEDAVHLARLFFERAGAETRSIRGFSSEAVAALLNAPWPGNVRELRNRVQRALIVGTGTQLSPEDLGLEDYVKTPGPTLREARRRAEEQVLRDALRRTGGNRSETARALGISRSQLYELLARYDGEDSDLV